MKPGSRLIQNIHRFSGITLGQFRSQFHTLALSARQGGGRLSQFNISQPHLLQHFDFIQNLRHILKELYSTIDGHVQYIGYGFTLIAHFQRLAVISFAVTNLARYQHIGQEIHFDSLVSVTAASLAASSGYIERETPRLIATDLRFGQTDKQIPDIREYSCIGGRIGTRCPAQRRLVYIHHLIYIVQSLHTVIGQRFLQRTVEML